MIKVIAMIKMMGVEREGSEEGPFLFLVVEVDKVVEMNVKMDEVIPDCDD